MLPRLPRHLAIAFTTLVTALPLRAGPPVSPEASRSAEQLVRRVAKDATEIVIGEVVRAEARAVDAGRRIVTGVIFRVDHRLRGGEAETLEVLLPGGALGDLAQQVGGVSRVAPGDRLLLFLRPEGPRGGRSSPARLGLTLLGPSLWRVNGDEAQLAPEAVRLVTRPGAPLLGPLRLPLVRIETLLAAPESQTP